MLLKELMEKYGDYEINEDKLMELIQEPNQKNTWQIKEGDFYYYMDSDGAIYDGIWDNCKTDKARLSMGNVFFNALEAAERRWQLEIESLLLKYGGTRKFIKDGYIVAIPNIVYDCRVVPYYIGNWQCQGSIYFETEEQCRNAIEKIGENRIKEELFQAK